jgi:hypothetical protein
MWKMMKNQLMKTILLALALGFAVPALAQKEADAVKAVLAAYSEAKEKIALSSETDDPNLHNDVVSTIRRNLPGSGPSVEIFHCYFDLDVQAEPMWEVHYRPYFITRKYNIAARNFYEEYLYDAASGRLLFVFLQGDTIGGTKNEERYYYDAEGRLVSENIKGERTIQDEDLHYDADLFRSLIAHRLDHSVR